MQRRIIVTDDNSKTLLIPELNETYHSTKGAIREAEHVFIKNGLSIYEKQKKVNIFEMGFGTGLNALVTLKYIAQKGLSIIYDCVEKNPLETDIIRNLDYCTEINANPNIEEAYYIIHESKWNVEKVINDQFRICKIAGVIQQIQLSPESYHLIYYDAFGPKVQPELWETEVLTKMYEILLPEGILVTYCAQGQFKRNLKAVGFEIESLPGPPGKREMVRARKK